MRQQKCFDYRKIKSRGLTFRRSAILTAKHRDNMPGLKLSGAPGLEDMLRELLSLRRRGTES